MSSIKITYPYQGTLHLSAPYNPDANSAYKAIGGRWSPTDRVWVFSAEDIGEVRDVLHTYFGQDERPVKKVNVLVELEGELGRTSGGPATLTMFGRTLVSRWSRDEDVSYAKDVILRRGEFDPSAGSAKYPAIGDVDGIVLEVRGVPVTHPDLQQGNVSVLEDQGNPALEALKDERAELLGRLSELDAIISTYTHEEQ